MGAHDFSDEKVMTSERQDVPDLAFEVDGAFGDERSCDDRGRMLAKPEDRKLVSVPSGRGAAQIDKLNLLGGRDVDDELLGRADGRVAVSRLA